MNLPVVLSPEQVIARYASGVLTIEASGHEDGVTNIHIAIDQFMPIEPPVFEVVGEQWPGIGMFPYDVRNSFKFAQGPSTITIHTLEGSRSVPVTNG